MASLSEESSSDHAFSSAGEGEIDPALLPLSRLALATTARNDQQLAQPQQQQQQQQRQQQQKAVSRDRSPLSAKEARERSREPSTGSQPSLHSSAGSDRVRGDSASLEGAAQQLSQREDVSRSVKKVQYQSSKVMGRKRPDYSRTRGGISDKSTSLQRVPRSWDSAL